MVNAISTLIGVELEGNEDYRGTVAGNNGYLYGIPWFAPRVIKFNPVDKSITHIRPDFGDHIRKWITGAMTHSGVIYCVPHDHRRGILKIDTNTDTVTELGRNLLPEQGWGLRWESCAAALNGCIYCMSSYARRIMKIYPNNNDSISNVGDDLGGGYVKY